MTLNAGVRYERHVGSLNAQSAQAGDFVGARSFPAQRGLVTWNTVVPRIAVAYDVAGNGRTVLKSSVSQYGQRQGSQLVDQFNPMRQNTENRTWTDANGDRVPQANEIGPGQGALDRGATVRIDPGLRRPTQWEATASVERQIADDFGIAASYFYRTYRDLTAVVNVAVTADDFSPVVIASPLDGQPFTVYNQSAASLGKVDNLLTNSSALEQRYQGAELTVNHRRDNLTLFGGVTVGWNRAGGSASRNRTIAPTLSVRPAHSRVLSNFSRCTDCRGPSNLSSHATFSPASPAPVYTVTGPVAGAQSGTRT